MTQFSLYGGLGAVTGPTAQQPLPHPEDLTAGQQLLQGRFGVELGFNEQWYTLGSFSPEDGELIGEERVFKLVIEGREGNEGNLYDVAVSVEARSNIEPDGLRVFTYQPTVRFANKGERIEMRFDIPRDTQGLQIHNFDAANGRVGLETAFRSLRMAASGQGVWRVDEVELQDHEKGKPAAVTFSQGRELPNDATFYITDQDGRLLPITLPILTTQSNHRPVLVARATPLSECLSVAFDASDSRDKDRDALHFDWQFGDGATGEGSTPVHRYHQSGSYIATVTVADDSGQVGDHAIQTLQVVVPQPPTAKAGPDHIIAPGEKVAFNASGSEAGEGRIVAYRWEFGDDKAARGKAVSHVFKRPGVYRVRLHVRNSSKLPCNVASDQAEIRVNAAPVAEAGEDQVASAGDPVTLDGGHSYDTDGKLVAYLWSLGDGSQQEGSTIQHVYDKPGRYPVTLTVEDDVNVANSRASDTLTITINHPPVAQAGADCKAAIGEEIVFDGRASNDPDGELVHYLWNFGDGIEAYGDRVVYAYKYPGTYRVTLTVKDHSGTRTDTKSDTLVVVVNAPPVAQAGADQLVTSSEVHFDGTASTDPDGRIIAYLWEFGDGATSSEPAPVHVYGSPGSYAVRLRVTDDSGMLRNTSVDTLNVVINAAPIADAGPDQVGEPGQDLIFDASGSIDPDGSDSTFFWDFGDGETAVGIRVAHQYANPGTYTVGLTVKDHTEHDAAVAYDEAKAVINMAPVANAGMDILAAPGDRVQLSAVNSFDLDGKIVSYRWQFSDAADVVDHIKTHKSYAEPGIYTARVTVTDDSGASNDTALDDVTIQINHQPKARPGQSITTSHNTITFDASASADPDGDVLLYTWDFGDGTPLVQGVSPTHTYAKGGTYPVVLTVDDGTGLSNATDTAALTVAINRPPMAVAGDHQIVCTKDVVVFDGSGSNDPEGSLLRYLWDFGDGVNAEGLNPTHVYEREGVYPVTLVVQDDSGWPENSDTDRLTVQVYEAPVAVAGPDQIGCVNTLMQFNGSASRDLDGVVNRFTWEFGDQSSVEGERVTHRYTEPGTYRVSLSIIGDTVGECDNSDTDELTATILPGPTAQIAGPDAVPVGEPITLDASASTSPLAPIASWQWDFGDGTTGEGETVTHTYAGPGRYRVSLRIVSHNTSSICNTAMTQTLVTVNAAPIAVAGDDQLVGLNQEVRLDASGSQDTDSGIATYAWDLGDGTKATGMQVRHRYLESGTFQVTLTVRDRTSLENNSATDTLKVTVNSPPQSVMTAPQNACVGEVLTFSGAESSDADGEIIKYEWNFGDGTADRGLNRSHTSH